ncbi:MAG: hypothetical protein ABJG68_15090 [Crocinitomicaceae bacterium]
MQEILSIPQPKNNQHIFWEHAIKTVFSTLITYAILFFVPIIMFGREKNSDYIRQKGEEISRYFNETPVMLVIICAIVALLLNLYLYIKNSKTKYIFKIHRKDKNILFNKSNLFYKSTTEESYQLNNVKLLLITSKSESGKRSTIRFFDTEFSKIIGDLHLDHVLFQSSKKEALKAIQELQKIGIEVQKVKGSSKNYSEKVLSTLTGFKK